MATRVMTRASLYAAIAVPHRSHQPLPAASQTTELCYKLRAEMSATAVLPDVGQRATRRIARRLLPFLFVLYVIAFLDRVNVGYAGLEMSRDLHFSDRIFGFGAGVFSIGYFLFEIPGALIV